MQKLILFLALFTFSFIIAQSNSEVYLFNINFNTPGMEVTHMTNVSNDPDYDSQPSFQDSSTLLFAGSNKGQTDIAVYDINTKTKTWFNLPTSGGEYSPQQIPGTSYVSAVRLDTTGLQRWYQYQKGSNMSSEMIEAIQVAYYSFYDDQVALAAVLSGPNLDLTWIDFQKKTADTIVRNSGRSIHRIPNKEAMSYTAVNEEGNHDIFQLDMKDKESYFVCQLPVGVQDYCWIDETRLLLGSNNKLYLYDLFGSDKWEEAADLSEFKIKNISRLTVSPDGKKLAIVAEPESD